MYSGDYPKCPICKKETLLPLSAVYATEAPGPANKTLAHWVCVGCGFYIGTGGTAGYDIPKDIGLGMFPEIAKKFLICKEWYEKALEKGGTDASFPTEEVQSPFEPESEFGKTLKKEKKKKD